MKRTHFFVSGDVQGVFYRHNTAKKARALGLKGFVRNVPDSRVEVLVEGEQSAVDELVSFCKEHPGYSKVKYVEVKEEKTITSLSFDDFKVRY